MKNKINSTYAHKNHLKLLDYKQTLRLGLSIQSEDLTHPKVPTGSDPKTSRPDQVTGQRWVICSKNRLRRVGLGFPPQNSKKPDPTDVPSISRKISRIQQKFPEFGDIFQIPASNFQIPTSNFQILATNFHISVTY